MSNIPEKFAYSVWPSFVDAKYINRHNHTSLGKVKNNLVLKTKLNLDSAIKNVCIREEILDSDISRLLLYPLGVTEFWKADAVGYNVGYTIYGLFLNKAGIDTLTNALKHKDLDNTLQKSIIYPSDILDMRKHFTIKTLNQPYGELH